MKIQILTLLVLGLATYTKSMFLVHKIMSGIPDAIEIFCRLTPDGDTFVHELKCANEATIFIISAMVGQIDTHRCIQNAGSNAKLGNERQDCDEVVTATRIVKQLCAGRNRCNIPTENFPNSCRKEMNQYINITYNCLTARAPFRPFANQLYGRSSLLFN